MAKKIENNGQKISHKNDFSDSKNQKTDTCRESSYLQTDRHYPTSSLQSFFFRFSASYSLLLQLLKPSLTFSTHILLARTQGCLFPFNLTTFLPTLSLAILVKCPNRCNLLVPSAQVLSDSGISNFVYPSNKMKINY